MDDKATCPWGVWFDDHIHVDSRGQLAIFTTREAAEKWMKKYAIPGCRIASIAVKE